MAGADTPVSASRNMEFIQDHVVVMCKLADVSLQFDELKRLVDVAGHGLRHDPEFAKYITIVERMTQAWVDEIYKRNGVSA